MAHITDRWMKTGPHGRKIRTDRHGQGQRWQAVWAEPDGTRKRKSFDTKDAAQAHLDSVNHATRAGTYVSADSGRIPVSAWARTWLASQTHLKAGGLNTVTGNVTKHILPRWGSADLVDITRAQVQAWVNDLTVAPATVHRIHGTFLKLMQAAVDERRIITNPARGVNLPRGEAREHRYLTVPEVDALIAVMLPQHRPITKCLAWTGMRFGEAAELRVKDINVKAKTAFVTRSVSLTTGTPVVSSPKTKTSRRAVPLPAEVLADVTESMEGKSRDALIYPTVQGKQFRKDNYARAFKIACAKVGLEGVRPHDLRHTAVSIAVAAGASVKLVQRMVGHTSAAITLDVYAGLFEQDLSVITDRVDELIARERASAAAPAQPPDG